MKQVTINNAAHPGKIMQDTLFSCDGAIPFCDIATVNITVIPDFSDLCNDAKMLTHFFICFFRFCNDMNLFKVDYLFYFLQKFANH
jgi:hypothetical protein